MKCYNCPIFNQCCTYVEPDQEHHKSQLSASRSNSVQEFISTSNDMVGKSKKKKLARKKKVEDPRARNVQYLDPLANLFKYQYTKDRYQFSDSCIRKMWKTSPRHCSSTLVRPWLVLADHDADPELTNQFMRREWSRYWHSRPLYSYRFPCSCCTNCNAGQGLELTWTKEERSLVDPNSPHDPLTDQFTNAIIFREKVYALSLQGTLATLDLDSHPRLQVSNVARAIPSAVSRGFRECLVECGGELMLIFLISWKSMNIVEDVEVYRLDVSTDKMSWLRMVSLGDYALFASYSSCIGIMASKFGYKRNCVYFTQVRDGGWWVFDMEDGRISPSWTRGSSHPTTPTVITSSQF